MPFEEVTTGHDTDAPSWLSPGDGGPVVMLDGPPPPDTDPSLRALWRRLPVPRVLVPAVLAALVLGVVAGAGTTYAVDHAGTDVTSLGRGSLEVRLDSEALAQGLDIYGLTRPALPLLITNHERSVIRVAELTWSAPGGRLVWYGDASGVDPGRQARLWGESEISCVWDASRSRGLFAYVLLPGGDGRTVRLVDPGSVAVFDETVQRACG